MMTIWLWVLLGIQGSAALEERIPLNVLYLGNQGTDRVASYESFLKEHFQLAVASDRDTFDPSDAEGFDVVLLDWSQSDVNIMEMEGVSCPLGLREKWTTPTVLLDSAGLLIATPWETTGSYG